MSIFGLAYMFSKPEVIDYIFGLMGAESFPATFNPYTAVGLLGGRLQSLMPKIMAGAARYSAAACRNHAHVSI